MGLYDLIEPTLDVHGYAGHNIIFTRCSKCVQFLVVIFMGCLNFNSLIHGCVVLCIQDCQVVQPTTVSSQHCGNYALVRAGDILGH